LGWADEELEMPEVWAFVHPDNTASRRVLDRAGFAQARLLPEKGRILLRRARGG
jgi:ribosomal-protein-alanine N-acetyltransferase